MFGIRVPEDSARELWDWTSLVLARASLRRSLRGLRVLDLGTGAIALHGIRMARRGAAVVSVDIVPTVAGCARRTLRLNNLTSVPVVCCDLARPFRRPFDLVCFNAVYIPTAWGQAFGLAGVSEGQPAALMQTWNGGADGCDELRRLLASLPAALAPGARALIGINTFYVPDDVARQLFLASGYAILQVHRLPLNPARVYEIAYEQDRQAQEEHDTVSPAHHPQRTTARDNTATNR